MRELAEVNDDVGRLRRILGRLREVQAARASLADRAHVARLGLDAGLLRMILRGGASVVNLGVPPPYDLYISTATDNDEMKGEYYSEEKFEVYRVVCSRVREREVMDV